MFFFTKHFDRYTGIKATETTNIFQLLCQLKNFVGPNAGACATLVTAQRPLPPVIARHEAISRPHASLHIPDCFVPRNDGFE